MKTSSRRAFIVIDNQMGKFRGSFLLDDIAKVTGDPEQLSVKAVLIYEKHLSQLTNLLTVSSKTKGPLKATTCWQLGEYIFNLKKDIAALELQIDDIYAHLARDLGLSKDFLTKVITFRRYLKDKRKIPTSLNWRQCRPKPRIMAELLMKRTTDA